VGPLELSRRATFALSTDLPILGFAVLDPPAPDVTPPKKRGRLAEYVK
jgi:hypothetical protein